MTFEQFKSAVTKTNLPLMGKRVLQITDVSRYHPAKGWYFYGWDVKKAYREFLERMKKFDY